MSGHHAQQDDALITRRAALVGAGALAASGSLLAATEGISVPTVPMQMVPATVARVRSDVLADVIPLGTGITLETDASSGRKIPGTNVPADFSDHPEGDAVLVVTSTNLPPGQVYGHGDPRRQRGPISADAVVPLSIGSIKDLAGHP